MKVKELNIEHKDKSQEDIAKEVIQKVYDAIASRKKSVKEAEDKLAELLEKDISDIKEDDGNSWDWD